MDSINGFPLPPGSTGRVEDIEKGFTSLAGLWGLKLGCAPPIDRFLEKKNALRRRILPENRSSVPLTLYFEWGAFRIYWSTGPGRRRNRSTALRFWMRGLGFSPMFALLKPTFSLPLRPPLLARVLPSKAERSPTDVFLHPTASADRLAPFIFGARALDQWAITHSFKGGCF